MKDFPQYNIVLPTPTKTKGLYFHGGETKGLERVTYYLESNLVQNYKNTRNGMLGMDYSTKFSPWLAFGCISPRLVYWEITKYESQVLKNESTYWVLFEMLWRDYWKIVAHRYGNGLFYLHGPNVLSNYKREWSRDTVVFQKWIDGCTGIPWVDAIMRELKTTGFIGNRARQNTASFLVHSLGIDWRWGACYFESQLIDYDPESNYGNWQYTAGVGCDPRKWRKFNMIKQAQDYDPQGEYVKYWVDELAHLKDGDIGLFLPWMSKNLKYVHPIVKESQWKFVSKEPKKRISDWKIQSIKL
jgi:deoxyribodipyrimidine photo-lyase